MEENPYKSPQVIQVSTDSIRKPFAFGMGCGCGIVLALLLIWIVFLVIGRMLTRGGAW